MLRLQAEHAVIYIMILISAFDSEGVINFLSARWRLSLDFTSTSVLQTLPNYLQPSYNTKPSTLPRRCNALDTVYLESVFVQVKIFQR